MVFQPSLLTVCCLLHTITHSSNIEGARKFRARFRQAKYLYLALRKRMKLRVVFYGLLVTLFCLLSSQTAALATGTGDALKGLSTSANQAGLTQVKADIPVLIGRWLAWVLGFTGTIFFILVVWAGLTWMTAAGNEENIKKAQNILKTAIIGLIIVLSAYAITKFVGTALQSQ